MSTDFPFPYDLHLTAIPGKSSRTILCFHGSGSSYQFVENFQHLTDSTLLSFNFPDWAGTKLTPFQATYGSIQELLPALYILKQVILDEQREQIDLYGLSAGGGAVINVLGVLNRSIFEPELLQIGIGPAEKKKIIQAIEKGIVLLDAPLKSVEEIIAFRGSTAELEFFATVYRKNKLRPIDALEFLQGLQLTILLYFEEEDAVLSNRDDALYIARLKKGNVNGTTQVFRGKDGGHSGPHHLLWNAYKEAVLK